MMSKSRNLGWPPVQINQRIEAHKNLARVVQRANVEEVFSADPSVSDELNRALARYLVVRSAGLLEAVRDDSASLHAKQIGPPRLFNRISGGLRAGQGVRPEQLIAFFKSFDPVWASALTEFLNYNDSKRSNDLGALVSARIKIAHGDGEQVTLRKALSWSDTAIEVSEKIVEIFDPR